MKGPRKCAQFQALPETVLNCLPYVTFKQDGMFQPWKKLLCNKSEMQGNAIATILVIMKLDNEKVK